MQRTLRSRPEPAGRAARAAARGRRAAAAAVARTGAAGGADPAAAEGAGPHPGARYREPGRRGRPAHADQGHRDQDAGSQAPPGAGRPDPARTPAGGRAQAAAVADGGRAPEAARRHPQAPRRRRRARRSWPSRNCEQIANARAGRASEDAARADAGASAPGNNGVDAGLQARYAAALQAAILAKWTRPETVPLGGIVPADHPPVAGRRGHERRGVIAVRLR